MDKSEETQGKNPFTRRGKHVKIFKDYFAQGNNQKELKPQARKLEAAGAGSHPGLHKHKFPLDNITKENYNFERKKERKTDSKAIV